MLAPNVKVQPKGKPFEAYIIAGSDALNKERAKLICELTRAEQGYKPVILTREAIEEERELAIKCGKVSIFRAGELSEKDKRSICENLAVNSTAEEVIFCDETGQPERDESGNLIADSSAFIKKLRDEYQSKELIKVKETDRASEKASAFRRWFNEDLAIQRGSGEFFRYTGKVWEKVDAEDIESAMVNFFDENRLGYSDRTISTVIKTFKIQLPKMDEPPEDSIFFDNGILNCKTLAFEPHKRENWLTTYIPHTFRENEVRTPHFNKWLNFVADGNQEKARNILAALYAILTNRYNWQMFFQVTGKGGSGKSVFANIATLLVGEKNIGAGRLENFDDERGLAGFEDKKLIICAEQTKYAGDGSGVKAVTGGDTVRIRHNYCSPIDTKVKASVMIINNEPCKWTERNGGVDRRAVNFCFDKVVPEKERDPDFMDKITLEVGGIIRKLLNEFPDPMEAKAALEKQQKSKESLKIKMDSDPLTAFFEYFYTTEKVDGLFIGNVPNGLGDPSKYLYHAYLGYVRALGLAALNVVRFTQGIEQSLNQHGNEYSFKKHKTDKGRKTNVHFKDYNDFKKEIIEPQ